MPRCRCGTGWDMADLRAASFRLTELFIAQSRHLARPYAQQPRDAPSAQPTSRFSTERHMRPITALIARVVMVISRADSDALRVHARFI